VSNKSFGVFENLSVDVADLSGQQLFRQVNLVGLESLLQDCPSLTLREGAALIEPGQANHMAYLVLVGSLHVYEGEAKGEPLAVIQKGECVGLMSLIDRQPAQMRIVAKQACRLLVIDEERFLALLNTSNAIARNVLSMVMQHLRGKNTGAPERGRLQQRLEQNSNIDSVTGLYNQRWLDGVLERQIMRAATDRKPLSVLAVAVDGLSQFKKEFGGELADHALAVVGQVIAANVRPTDMVARHESGHFIVVLPETDIPGAEIAATRIREAVAQTAIEIPGACRLPPLNVITGQVQMKAFVAARKLVDDAIGTLNYREPAALPLAAAG
jgi:diguanylate cyclase (GGDEF)-like protein